MKAIQDFLSQLTGGTAANAFVEQMLAHIEGFREGRERYLLAIGQLGAEQVDAAITKRFTADILFAAFLGLQMNLEHFKNPISPNCTWPQLDYNDYLREDLAHSLPDYLEADQVLTAFCSSLTEEQDELRDAIMDYDSYLVTYGPKLAHYYGYLLGNTLLRWLVPGYREDAALTYKYNMMLGKYFGKFFLPIML